MSRSLPDDREKALEAIANGWGRTATSAHPLCVCRKTVREACWYCKAKRDQPCVRTGSDEDYWLAAESRHMSRGLIDLTRNNCPVHKGRR
jgi:hypothetical protein